jgi:hypothetical protein
MARHVTRIGALRMRLTAWRVRRRGVEPELAAALAEVGLTADDLANAIESAARAGSRPASSAT